MKGVYARTDADTAAKRIALLGEMKDRELNEKIADSQEIIARALTKGRAAILYSGGRDSTVLLHLAQAAGPLVLHNDTTLGDPATLEFIRSWCRKMDYHETTAQDPIEMWQRTGYFPILSKRGFTAYKKRIPGLKTSPVQCCYQLKERYANQVLNRAKTGVVFWGNRAGESMRRRMTFIDNGFLFKPKKYAWWQAYPLQHWTDTDIAEYLRKHLPEYPHAEAGIEAGCRPCGTDLTFYPNNLSRLYQRDRAEWEKYMRCGFAEQIMKIKGIAGDPETVIREKPLILLQVGRNATKTKKTK